jgi:Protein of unknown function (DUF3108)
MFRSQSRSSDERRIICRYLAPLWRNVPRDARRATARGFPALGFWPVIVIALIAGMPGSRRAAAEDVVAVYAAYWAGMPAAHIRLTLRDSSPGYRDEIEIATEGLPYLFTRFHATALAEGRIVADRLAEPLRYFASYDLRKRRDRRVSMQFVRRSAGTLAERGPDDTSRKPPLAELFRNNAVDPLSALERIREALRATKPGGSFTVPVYDGARRFDVVGRMLPRNGCSDGILHAELTLRPIAGFKGETSEDGDPDDAPRKVELALTDDARMLPLSITVPVFFMPLVVQFQHLCAAPDACPG